MVRYEELKEDTSHILWEVSEFLNLNLDDSQIKAVSKKYSLSKEKKWPQKACI